MKKFIEDMRAKPEHIRKRFAFGVAGGATAVIALFWLVTLVSLPGANPFAINTDISSVASVQTPSGSDAATATSNLAGAAAALFAPAKPADPTLTIIDSNAPPTPTTTEDQAPQAVMSF